MYKFKQEEAQEAGLRLWIAFILGFWLAGLRAELCIFLGAVGGLATWHLVGNWLAEKVESPPARETEPPAPSKSSPLEQVFRTPAERFRQFDLSKRLPKLPTLPKLPSRQRKPRKRL